MGNCFNKGGPNKVIGKEKEAKYRLYDKGLNKDSSFADEKMDPEMSKIMKQMPAKPTSKDPDNEDPIAYATWKTNCIN